MISASFREGRGAFRMVLAKIFLLPALLRWYSTRLAYWTPALSKGRKVFDATRFELKCLLPTLGWDQTTYSIC